jgi:hypothetical protein
MGNVSRLGSVCALAVLLVVAMATASGAQDAELVIETQVTLNPGGPPSGTFEATSGADNLGCDSGSYADAEEFTPVEGSDNLFEVTKVLTCESGPNAGTISIVFVLDDSTRDQSSTWEITEATGDFVGLVGGGDFQYVSDSELTGVETISGNISVPESSELAQTGSETTTAMLVGGSLILFGLVALALRPRLDTR